MGGALHGSDGDGAEIGAQMQDCLWPLADIIASEAIVYRTQIGFRVQDESGAVSHRPCSWHIRYTRVHTRLPWHNPAAAASGSLCIAREDRCSTAVLLCLPARSPADKTSDYSLVPPYSCHMEVRGLCK